jgi:hypothetical protein
MKYPNPIRLLSLNRDEWLFNILDKTKVPFHFYNSIRSSQLAQLVLPIESMRLKKIRRGEEAGPSIFDNEDVGMYIPFYQIFRMLIDYIEGEKVNLKLSENKKGILENETMKIFIENKMIKSEWVETLDDHRLIEIYLLSSKVYYEVILPLIGKHLKLNKTESVIDKIKEDQEQLHTTLTNLFEADIYNLILDNKWKREDDETIILEQEDEEDIKLNYFEFLGKAKTIHSIILEFHRYIKQGKKYSIVFPSITPILVAEIVTTSPQPKIEYIPVITKYFGDLQVVLETDKEFFNMLTMVYKLYCYLDEPNSRIISKQYKTIKKEFLKSSRLFWNKATDIMKNTRLKKAKEYELIVSTIWIMIRSIQAQIQQSLQDPNFKGNLSKQSLSIMQNIEQNFWSKASKYTSSDKLYSRIHFWSIYTKIATSHSHSPKEALHQFTELDNLIDRVSNFSKSKTNIKFDILIQDQYSILQRVLSYGIEARSFELFKKIEEYNNLLIKILEKVESEELDLAIQMDEGKQTYEFIKDYISSEDNIPQLPEQASPRRLR